MGNEMGNNNVSGTQEQENTKVEAANKSAEVFQAPINAGDVKAKKQPVASKKEGGFHEKLTGLSSEEPSGVSVAHIEKDGREQENTEVEATNRIPEASLPSITAGNITAENQPVPSLKDDISHEKHTGLSSDEEPSGVSHPHIQTDSSDEREPDKTEVQVFDGSAKAPLSSNDSKDQVPKSVSPAVDGNFHETDAAFENSPGIGTTDHQVQKEVSIERDGEELKSSSLDAESSPQDSEYVESVCAPTKPVEDGSKLEGIDEDVLGLNGPYRDIEKNEEKLEYTPEASIISSKDSVEEATSMDDGPNEHIIGCQEEVVDLCNSDEKMIETTNGVEVGKPSIDADEKEGDKEVQLKAVAATNSLESFQREAPESDVILIIKTEVTKVFENETGEQDYCHGSITHTDHGSLEESKLTNMNSNGSEFIMGMGADHEEKKGSEKESQTDVTIITENENQVDFHDRKMSLSCDENVTDLENEDEPVIETLTEITAVTTNVEEEKGKEGDLYSPDSVMFSSCQTEPEENLVKTYVVSSDQFQDGNQKLTLLESEMQENLRSLILESNQESHNKTDDSPDSEFLTIETSVQHEAFDISIEQSQLNEPAGDQDSNTALRTMETHESSGTGSNQEVLKNPIADTEDPSSKESRKEDAEHLNTNAKVTEFSSYDLLPPEVQHDDSVPTALLYQVNMSKTDDLSIVNSVAEKEFAAVESEALVEKQVIAVEITDPEKLKTPPLSYLEEENDVVEALKKQERHVLKKTVAEEMLNSVSSSSPPDKVKRKPKYSLFSNCICCTAVIQ